MRSTSPHDAWSSRLFARLHTLVASIRRRGSRLSPSTRILVAFLALVLSVSLLPVRCHAHLGTNRVSAESYVSDAATSRLDDGGAPYVELPVLLRLDAPDGSVGPLTEALTGALMGAGLLVVGEASADDPIAGHRILQVTVGSDAWWTPLYAAGTTTVTFACGPWTSELRAGSVPALPGPDAPDFFPTWSAGGRIDVHGEFIGWSTLGSWRRLQAESAALHLARSLAEAKRKLRTGH